MPRERACACLDGRRGCASRGRVAHAEVLFGQGVAQLASLPAQPGRPPCRSARAPRAARRHSLPSPLKASSWRRAPQPSFRSVRVHLEGSASAQPHDSSPRQTARVTSPCARPRWPPVAQGAADRCAPAELRAAHGRRAVGRRTVAVRQDRCAIVQIPRHPAGNPRARRRTTVPHRRRLQRSPPPRGWIPCAAGVRPRRSAWQCARTEEDSYVPTLRSWCQCGCGCAGGRGGTKQKTTPGEHPPPNYEEFQGGASQ